MKRSSPSDGQVKLGNGRGVDEGGGRLRQSRVVTFG